VHDIYASDYVLHGPFTDPELRGREGVQQFVNASREAFHEVDITVEDQIVEGDKVVTRWKARIVPQSGVAGFTLPITRLRGRGSSSTAFPTVRSRRPGRRNACTAYKAQLISS
jgi:hypothetical protein